MIKQTLKMKEKIKNNPALTTLIEKNEIEFIANSTEEGYENYSVFSYQADDMEFLVLLEKKENGNYEYFSVLPYNNFLLMDLDISKDAAELRMYLYCNDTMDNIPNGTSIRCLGHYANAYRLWLFQYKNAYVLLSDTGNGHYKFFKEIKDLSEAPINY